MITTCCDWSKWGTNARFTPDFRDKTLWLVGSKQRLKFDRVSLKHKNYTCVGYFWRRFWKGKAKSIWREIFHFFKFVYNLGDSLEFDTFFDIFLKIRQIGLIFRKIMVKQVNLTNYFQVCLYFTWFPWIWHIFWHLLKN